MVFKSYFQQFFNSGFMEYVINLKIWIVNIYEGFLMPTMTKLQCVFLIILMLFLHIDSIVNKY